MTDMSQTASLPISKRIMDLCLTLPALIVLSPVLLILALVVWIGLGSPVLFEQERPGYRTKLFKIYKFRSMRAASSEWPPRSRKKSSCTDTGAGANSFSQTATMGA